MASIKPHDEENILISNNVEEKNTAEIIQAKLETAKNIEQILNANLESEIKLPNQEISEFQQVTSSHPENSESKEVTEKIAHLKSIWQLMHCHSPFNQLLGLYNTKRRSEDEDKAEIRAEIRRDQLQTIIFGTLEALMNSELNGIAEKLVKAAANADFDAVMVIQTIIIYVIQPSLKFVN